MSDDRNAGDRAEFPPSPLRAEPDAHGQAALLLAESILHVLVETKTLTVADAIGIIRTASAVKVEVARETGESEGRMRQSLGLLAAIERSLVIDGDGAAGAGELS